MAEDSRGFGEQLFARLQGKGLSRAQIYKALALQRLNEDVLELGTQGLLSEPAMIEISKISSGARQKQLAEIAVAQSLSNPWVKELARLIRNAEKAASDKEANRYWDLFFEVKDGIERGGATKELLDKVKNFSVDKLAAETVSERTVIDFKKYDLELGRGLDVGTSNICAAARTTDGRIVYNIQRNAFLDVRSDTFTRKMLMKLGVDHITHGDKGYVIGDPAFELANIFEKNTRRPMKDGMISPLESEALLIVNLIISQLLGHPREVGEVCSFSVPADPVDAERNVIYHRGALESILRKIGYTPRPMLEGHSVVFGELAEEDYTGIGISAGAGMFNVCIAYKSVPALTLATSRGGDWVDNNTANALGIPSSQACAIKESGIDLMRPRDRVEEAIVIYYRNLIQYTLDTIRDAFEKSQNMPSFNEPVSLVCAGGTSMVKGFIDIFREVFGQVHFPIDVKEIRMARDPLRTVSAGCLAAAREETRAMREPVEMPKGPVNLGRAAASKITKIDTRRFMRPASAPVTTTGAPETRAPKAEPPPPPTEDEGPFDGPAPGPEPPARSAAPARLQPPPKPDIPLPPDDDDFPDTGSVEDLIEPAPRDEAPEEPSSNGAPPAEEAPAPEESGDGPRDLPLIS